MATFLSGKSREENESLPEDGRTKGAGYLSFVPLCPKHGRKHLWSHRYDGRLVYLFCLWTDSTKCSVMSWRARLF